MSYEAWRIAFQSAEHAAKAAYEVIQQQNERITALQGKLDSINGISTRCDKTVDMFGSERIEG